MSENDKEETPKPPTSEELKEHGNVAVKNQRYEEAILHYTYAIKLDPGNFTLYSNRSFAFLKVQQYYHALADANETIRLNPAWPKGYFRRAEIENATEHFKEATASYQKALDLKPEDEDLRQALHRTKRLHLQDRKSDDVIPWLGAGIGIVAGVIIVIADYILTSKPTHPLLMVFVTIFIALIGFGIAKSYRYYTKCQRDGLLDPPANLLEMGDKTRENEVEDLTNQKDSKPHARYTKSQARQRYKKGKMF